jgi:hypothetical protein
MPWPWPGDKQDCIETSGKIEEKHLELEKN